MTSMTTLHLFKIITPANFAILPVLAVCAVWPHTSSAGEPELISAERIWDQAPHNAFTDLIRDDGRWLCVFREGTAHVSPDGSLRIIESSDGKNWQSLALVEHPTEDLRDAKISHTPDGKLLLNGAGMIADAEIRYHSMSWLSEDGGKSWKGGQRIGDPGFWLWRVQWHKDKAYSMGYRTDRDRSQRILRFYQSSDGMSFDTLIPSVATPAGCGEDKILFDDDDNALCLLRHEFGNKLGQLGKAAPPYTDWTWTDINHRIGGPNLIRLPDGRIVAAVRLYDKAARTSLCWLDPENSTLTEFLKLPSGGDTSYAGMVWHDEMLWISYYSSHEEKTAIYLAKVKF